jgi:two-component system LytT family response regulator
VFAWISAMPMVQSVERDVLCRLPRWLDEPEADVIVCDGMGGEEFSMLEQHLGTLPARPIIAITDTPTCAARAYDLGLADYLVRPVARYRLVTALQRAALRVRVAHRGGAHMPPNDVRGAATSRRPVPASAHDAPPAKDRIAVKEKGGRLKLIEAADITWIEAAGNYVLLHVGPDTYMVHASISGMHERLDAHRFVRIHRSRVINKDKVQSLSHDADGGYQITLEDGVTVRSSRRRRETLFQALGI